MRVRYAISPIAATARRVGRVAFRACLGAIDGKRADAARFVRERMSADGRALRVAGRRVRQLPVHYAATDFPRHHSSAFAMEPRDTRRADASGTARSQARYQREKALAQYRHVIAAAAAWLSAGCCSFGAPVRPHDETQGECAAARYPPARPLVAASFVLSRTSA
ncbi:MULTISPECIES: hypothetical protein [Burkholderia]|uniref:hypothetical protein n=1 Tax=Burkholderia TaxID=32008 RepID=UPI001269AEED|nr:MULTISPECIES: hypothetical protein [Burkholderia]